MKPMVTFLITWEAGGEQQTTELPAESESDARDTFNINKLPGVEIVSIEPAEFDDDAPAIPTTPKRSPFGRLLLPFQSFIVLAFPFFLFLNGIVFSPILGYRNGSWEVASAFLGIYELSCLVLLIAGLVLIFEALFGAKSDKQHKQHLLCHACINFGLVGFGVLFGWSLLSYIFIK